MYDSFGPFHKMPFNMVENYLQSLLKEQVVKYLSAALYRRVRHHLNWKLPIKLNAGYCKVMELKRNCPGCSRTRLKKTRRMYLEQSWWTRNVALSFTIILTVTCRFVNTCLILQNADRIMHVTYWFVVTTSTHLNWSKCLFAEHTSDSSTNCDSFD